MTSTVFITGATSGFGEACARRFAEAGWSLVLTGRRQERLDALCQELSQQTEVHGLVLDVRDRKAMEAAIANLPPAFAKLRGLINNAGLGGSRLLVEMGDEEWNRVLDVTLTGTMRMTRAMLPRMMERRAGVIVNHASVLGWRAQTEQAHYAAAKAGVMALTRCVAVEAADYGIRINAVSPSIALHDFLRRSAPQEVLDKLAANEAFGRAAEVWEVANVMMFLASDYSSYMTGEVLSVSSQRA
ncbi:3-oxoacyl-[acyl-carrier-protein] reductase FabG [compost metagenome]